MHYATNALGRAAAFSAVDSLRNVEINGITLFVEFSNNFKKYLMEQMDRKQEPRYSQVYS